MNSHAHKYRIYACMHAGIYATMALSIVENLPMGILMVNRFIFVPDQPKTSVHWQVIYSMRISQHTGAQVGLMGNVSLMMSWA